MKKILAAALALILALALCACGNSPANTGNPTDNNTPTDSGGAFAYGDGTGYIAEHLKGDYSITYNYSVSGSDGSGDALTVTFVRTSAGYYYNMGGGEVLYVKNGDKYDLYAGSAESGFERVTYMEPVTREEAEAQMAMVTGFMTQYGGYASDMTRDGTDTVAGRSCDKYSYSAAAMGAAVRYSYSIDRETGVCLRFSFDAVAGGQGGGMTYECTEFKTSGVTLPAY